MFTKNNESMKRTENNNSVVNIIGQGTSILGDINSVKNGKIKQRVTNRLIGKFSAKLTSKTSKNINKLLK